MNITHKAFDLPMPFRGTFVMVRIHISYWFETDAFDGDDPQDIEAYSRGDFVMAGVEVAARWKGMEGTDSLGMNCIYKASDIDEVVEENGMIHNAAVELFENVEELLKSVRVARA